MVKLTEAALRGSAESNTATTLRLSVTGSGTIFMVSSSAGSVPTMVIDGTRLKLAASVASNHVLMYMQRFETGFDVEDGVTMGYSISYALD